MHSQALESAEGPPGRILPSGETHWYANLPLQASHTPVSSQSSQRAVPKGLESMQRVLRRGRVVFAPPLGSS